MASIVYNRGLPPKLVNNIENRKYTVDELEQIHNGIQSDYDNRKSGLGRAVIMLVLCFTLVMFLASLKSPDPLVARIIFWGLAIMILVNIIYLRRNLVDKSKRQFVKAIKKGYPELRNQFGEDSFP